MRQIIAFVIKYVFRGTFSRLETVPYQPDCNNFQQNEKNCEKKLWLAILIVQTLLYIQLYEFYDVETLAQLI